MNLEERKQRKDGENFLISNLIISACHLILLKLLNQQEYDGRVV
jgi:hypothetical protein